MRMVVGLGNPGPEYEETRHNVGFFVLDQMAAGLSVPFERERKWKAEMAKTPEGLFLVKPQTYMNLSGEAVQRLCSFHRISPAELLVVVDDMDLPFGRLRLRREGSAGGHNGLRSIFQHLGTTSVARLKVGVGRPDNSTPGAAHVLGKFREEERSLLEKVGNAAIEAVLDVAALGLEQAMNRHNVRRAVGEEGNA